MAQPYFQVRHFEKTHGLVVFSANFTLYTDMSQRIVTILQNFSPDVNPYSIDESFCIVPKVYSRDLDAYGKTVRQAVLQQTGIGTGVGIATTKTLAKLANVAAKKYPKTGGVVDLITDPKRRERLLSIMPVNEVWGVGKALTTKLDAIGITTALELAQLSTTRAKSQFSVVLSRTVAELNGESVLPWEEDHVINQQIIASRSLGGKITDKETIYASIVHHVGRGVRKLRAQEAVATSISVSIRTNAYAADSAQYSNTATAYLPSPSDDMSTFATLAREAFNSVWREGHAYATTGITINDIIPKANVQSDLFAEPTESSSEKSEALTSTVEKINQRYGLGTAIVASQRQGTHWQPRSEHRSPEYTTRWSDIPLVKA